MYNSIIILYYIMFFSKWQKKIEQSVPELEMPGKVARKNMSRSKNYFSHKLC